MTDLTRTGVDRIAWVRTLLDHADGVTTSTLCVAMAMAEDGNRDGTRVHPGVKRLMARTRASKSTVDRALAWLTAEGFLIVVLKRRPAKWSGGKGLATVYRLTIPMHLVGTLRERDRTYPVEVGVTRVDRGVSGTRQRCLCEGERCLCDTYTNPQDHPTRTNPLDDHSTPSGAAPGARHDIHENPAWRWQR